MPLGGLGIFLSFRTCHPTGLARWLGMGFETSTWRQTVSFDWRMMLLSSPVY